MLDFLKKKYYTINDLLEIMAILRSNDGCPWDKEQTHKSIRNNFIEEVYEAIEAIDNNDTALLREELGDVLLQVIFHSQMEAELSSFSFNDVVNELCIKLVVRHPHVFGEVQANTTDEVLTNWEMIKNKTKGTQTYSDTLTSVPMVLPALIRASKVGQRAARAGMDFEELNQSLSALKSEISELEDAINSKNENDIFNELGDVLFSCVNVSRKLDINSEEALTRSCDKFIQRFKNVEILTKLDGIDMKSLSINQLDVYWDRAKKEI